MTLNELSNIKLVTQDSELRRVVEQINNILKSIRANNTVIETEINGLPTFEDKVDLILVDQYGDVLTDENGEVLLDS